MIPHRDLPRAATVTKLLLVPLSFDFFKYVVSITKYVE